MSGIGEKTGLRIPVWLVVLVALGGLGVVVANPWRAPDIELVGEWGSVEGQRVENASIRWSVGVGPAAGGHDVTGRGGHWGTTTTGAPGDVITLALAPVNPAVGARVQVFWHGRQIAQDPPAGGLRIGGATVTVVIPGA